MKIALVTGGSKGIGLHTVLRMVELGYQVITCSRSAVTWQEAVSIHPQLESVDYQSVDIGDDEALGAFYEYIQQRYGRLDYAVNNASPALVSGGCFHTLAAEKLKATLDVDFWAQALCFKHEIELMSDGGAIVNVSSINGIRPTPNAAMFSAAKYALEGLTQSVALENIGAGIRINSVAPGVTWTPRWEDKLIDKPNIREDVSDVVPLKRFANSQEIVNAIEFLLSDKASYIVGHTLVVDGGLTLTW
ncbi:MAG: SDR family NAD(P)-dependent oxidoreductase [Vibrio sp.]